MSTIDIIRAWTDPEYRETLTDEEQSLIPAHPAGMLELDDAELEQVAGGNLSVALSCSLPTGTCLLTTGCPAPTECGEPGCLTCIG